MNQLVKSLSKHLTSNNWWIHVTVLTVISFLYYMTFRMPFGNLIYLNEYKWITFITFLLSILAIYSPIIIYSILRKRISRVPNQWIKYGIWATIFILYPITYMAIEGKLMLSGVSIMAENITLIGIVILIVEIFSNPQPAFNTSIDISEWKEKVSPEWIVIIIFLMMAGYTTMYLFMEHQTNHSGYKSFFWISIQSLLVIATYYIFYIINHYFLVNKIYRSQGIIYYAFSFLALMYIFLIPISTLLYYLPAFSSVLSYRLGEDWIGPNSPTAFWSIYSTTVFYIMYLTIPITILVQWIGMAKRVNSLEKEKTDSELNLLKQQINPHFFFNTLNNIYSMSRKQSEDTPEAILQLSDLMRYVIYKGQENTVTLQQEIKYIEDYIELQKLRLHQNFDCQFDINVDKIESHVTPLLFIILVENAFKHGIETASEDSYLHIRLDQDEKGITFSCSNSIEDHNTITTTGLGLTNLKRRLELGYPDSHSLDVQKSDRDYQAILRIDS